MVAGEESPEWNELMKRDNVFSASEDRQEIAQVLDGLIARNISIVDENEHEIPDIYVYHRKSENGHLYFLANTSRTRGYDATVRLSAAGKVSRWDASDASVHQVPASASGGKTALRLHLPPAGSTILTIEQVAHGKPSLKLEEVQRLAIQRGPWSFRRTHLNSMTLDRCRLSINDEPFGEWQPVWKARREILRFFDLEKYQGIQPWALAEKDIVLNEGNAVQLQFEFEVEKKPERIHLVMEEGFKFDLRVNGQNVNTVTDQWHWDRQFSRINIHDQVVEGGNVIQLRCNYQWDTEIEEVYLVGDFAVGTRGTKFRITREPAKLEPGDWGTQGYPFYSGSMIYQGEVELKTQPDRVYLLDVSKAKGSLCRVSVNEKDAGIVAWHPWRIDVTRLIENGRNTVAVEVVSTLRNTMGPLHHKAKDDLSWVGPEQFVDEANWTDVYNFAPYGIFGDLELVVCRRTEQT